MKILIIRLSGFAEVLLTTALIRCLRQQTSATIHLITDSENEPAVKGNPYLDTLHLHYHDVNNENRLRQEAYTHVMDLQGNAESRVIALQTGVEPLHLAGKNFGALLNETLGLSLFPAQHLVDRYFVTARSLQTENDGRGLDFYIPAEGRISMADIPASHHMGYVVLHLHAPHAALNIGALKKFCASLQHPIILTGTLYEQMLAQELATADPVKIYNACGKFSFSENADLFQQSKLLIAADAAAVQIAAALQKPVIVWNGRRLIAAGTAPYYGNRWGKKKMHLASRASPITAQPLLHQTEHFLAKGKLP